MAHIRVSATAILAMGVAAGCYNYSPLVTPSPDTGSYVSVILTSAGSQALAPAIGPNVFAVRGHYIGASDGALLLSVTSVELQRGDALPWAGERLAVPNDYVASLELRRLSRGRSLLLAGVGVVGVVAVGSITLTGGGTDFGVANGPPGKK